jgi:hypothetical protein
MRIAMTTAIDADTELEIKRTEWMEALHDIYVFFAEHPEMIDGTGIVVSRWVHDDNNGTARERVGRFSALTGPNRVSEVSPGSTYAQVMSDRFFPFHLHLYAEKVAVGHKVRDAVPEEWEWDALGEQS